MGVQAQDRNEVKGGFLLVTVGRDVDRVESKIPLGWHERINNINNNNFYSLLLLWLSSLNTKTKKKAGEKYTRQEEQ